MFLFFLYSNVIQQRKLMQFIVNCLQNVAKLCFKT